MASQPAKIPGYPVQGKVVLVTGANRGIGKALVEAFVEHGAAKVYAAVRTLPLAQPLVDASPTKVVAVYMDLSQPETIVAAATTVATDVDIVVNNAGVLSYTNPLEPTAVQELQREMQVNVYGFMTIAQAFAPILKQRGGGVLCQLNSVGSLRAHPAVGTYAASKAASYSITQTLRTSLQAQNTLVVSVHPGPVATDMIAQNEALQKLTAESPANVAHQVIQSIQNGDFLCFPDPLSNGLSMAYHPYADHVFEQGNMY